MIPDRQYPHWAACSATNASRSAANTGDPVVSTVFRFTLMPADGGTQLTVVESGFQNLEDPFSRMEDNRGGWTSELDELVAYLEGSA